MKEAILQKAFQLAALLFPDRATAIQIVVRSVDALEVAAQRQVKRMKHEGRRGKTKVLLSDPQLLQTLVSFHADQYQRAQEMTGRPEPPNHRQMVVRWIQQIALISHSNAFHAAVGQCRILHRYSTSETRSLYETLLQSADRGKDDDQYRRAKSRLFQALLERFADRVILAPSGPRGEENFAQDLQTDAGMTRLANECQAALAPWGLNCVPFPAEFRADRDPLPDLASCPGDLDREAELELQRLFTVAHPDSFRQLARGLSLAPPEATLFLPRFTNMMSNDNDRPAGKSSTIPELFPEELAGIRTVVQARHGRRANSRLETIRVRINGADMTRARVSGDSPVELRVSLSPAHQWIEILGQQHSTTVLLALIFLERDDLGDPAPGVYDVPLARRSRVRAEVEGGQLTVSYRPGRSAARVVAGIAGTAAQLADYVNQAITPPRHSMAHRIRGHQPQPGTPSAGRNCPNCGGTLQPEGDGRLQRCTCGFCVVRTD